MPPLAIPPTVALATLGAAFLGRWVLREYRRVNAELDKLRSAVDPNDGSQTRTLQRDPATGQYRL